MEVSTIALGVLLATGLVAWWLLQGRRRPIPVTIDRLLGPLPESESAAAEMTDAAPFPPITSTGSTPASTDPIPSAWAASQIDAAEGLLSRLAGSGGAKLGIAAEPVWVLDWASSVWRGVGRVGGGGSSGSATALGA